MVREGYCSAGAAVAPGLARPLLALHRSCQVQLKPLDQQQAARMVWKANRQDGVRSGLNEPANQRYRRSTPWSEVVFNTARCLG